jgi:hypothetical protein
MHLYILYCQHNIKLHVRTSYIFSYDKGKNVHYAVFVENSQHHRSRRLYIDAGLDRHAIQLNWKNVACHS